MVVKGLKRAISFGLIIAVAMVIVTPIFPVASAQTDEGFSLQVSPSPLVATVGPNADTTLELQIRNTNTTPQALKMGLRSFTIDSASGQVKLGDAPLADVLSMISFASPTFTLEAGQIFTQRIYVHTDKNKGFSYNFAVTVSQQNPPKAVKGQSTIAGSVAVFTLITVNKPGAERKFELSKLSVSKHSYEYLPAEISIKLKNTGNINVQPVGSVFIQRHSDDTKPLATLAINDGGGYILPGTSRTFTASWNDGFPHYETVSVGDKATHKLIWRGSALSKLRMGRYVAKVVAIYDDGGRDIPVMAEISFWVIPWRMLLAAFVVIAILVVGVFVTLRSAARTARRASRRIKHTSKNHSDEI